MNQSNIRGRVLLNLDYHEFVTYKDRYKLKYTVKAREAEFENDYQRIICAICNYKKIGFWDICCKIVMQMSETELGLLVEGTRVNLDPLLSLVEKNIQSLVGRGVLVGK